MRSLRYLNAVLTIIAVLLTLNLWTAWTTTPGGQMLRPEAAYGSGTGIPNAGQQRREIVDQLKLINTNMGDLNAMFKNGKARVRVQDESAGKRKRK